VRLDAPPAGEEAADDSGRGSRAQKPPEVAKPAVPPRPTTPTPSSGSISERPPRSRPLKRPDRVALQLEHDVLRVELSRAPQRRARLGHGLMHDSVCGPRGPATARRSRDVSSCTTTFSARSLPLQRRARWLGELLREEVRGREHCGAIVSRRASSRARPSDCQDKLRFVTTTYDPHLLQIPGQG
jgi:hypothetical protein